jgi:hypothetical protein
MKAPKQIKLDMPVVRRCPPQYLKDGPLSDGDPFPFGAARRNGLRMCQVDLKFYRWFLQQPWAAKWPRVQEYALEILRPEREAVAAASRKPRAVAPAPKPSAAASQAAFEEFKRQTKELLTGGNRE